MAGQRLKSRSGRFRAPVYSCSRPRAKQRAPGSSRCALGEGRCSEPAKVLLRHSCKLARRASSCKRPRQPRSPPAPCRPSKPPCTAPALPPPRRSRLWVCPPCALLPRRGTLPCTAAALAPAAASPTAGTLAPLLPPALMSTAAQMTTRRRQQRQQQTVLRLLKLGRQRRAVRTLQGGTTPCTAQSWNRCSRRAASTRRGGASACRACR